jgi:N-acetylglucosamine-6-phosphate deacetylase
MVTHVFDAMRPFTHRDPGIVGVALTRWELTVGLIADPSHAPRMRCGWPSRRPPAGSPW